MRLNEVTFRHAVRFPAADGWRARFTQLDGSLELLSLEGAPVIRLSTPDEHLEVPFDSVLHMITEEEAVA